MNRKDLNMLSEAYDEISSDQTNTKDPVIKMVADSLNAVESNLNDKTFQDKVSFEEIVEMYKKADSIREKLTRLSHNIKNRGF